MALGPDLVRGTHRSAEGTSSTFGALGGAASMARLDEMGMRFAISYAAQQVSGLWSWVRDEEHIEKAFDFAGMGARNGVTAVSMVQAGFSGVPDVLEGEHNMFIAMSTQPKPEEMVADLGRKFYVTETAIKTYSVGYPIQAPLDAFLTLRRQNNLTPDNVQHVLVRLPADGAGIVNNNAMPDVNLQHLVAVALQKGAVSFEDSHSRPLMQDRVLQELRKRVELVGDKALQTEEAPRAGFVEVTLKDGRKVNHFTKYPPGTKESPLDTEGVNAKVRDLMTPVLGKDKTEALIKQVNALEMLDDVRKLRPLLTV
jgi:2-methylcitrate dehydratase PrpD